MIQYEGVQLEIAKYIGEPINNNLPVPVGLTEICDVHVVEPGEKTYYYASQDTDDDEIYVVNTSTGELTAVKRNPLGVTELSFQGLNSKKEYVLLDTIMDTPDQQVLGRKKSRITAALDKLEVRLLLAAITASDAVQTVTKDSGEDLYDVIVQGKHSLEDYGDNIVLLAGTTVKEKIDTYDKDKAGTFNYNVTLQDQLAKWGITVRKIFGKVKYTGDESMTRLLAAARFIMVSRNSTISDGKPCIFVRRKISPQIAQFMGATVDNAQRALIVDKSPTNIGGTDTLGYGIVAYEKIIQAITSPKNIVKCTNDVV